MNTSDKTILFFGLLALMVSNVSSGLVKDKLMDWATWRLYVASERLAEKEDPIKDANSGSKTELKGFFKVKVLGTGRTCFVKQYQYDFSEKEQFGNFASTNAFLNFYGEPLCEDGDVGFAFGIIKASVVAEAYEKGPECLARVLSSVSEHPLFRFAAGDVDLNLKAVADGNATAMCEN